MSVAALTKTDPSYPGYVNLQRLNDGAFVLTVRGDPVDGKCGETAVLRLSGPEFVEWLERVDALVFQ